MNQTFGNQHHPVEIRLKREERALEIDFDDGRTFRLPAELLRVESPSAEVQGHNPSQKTIIAGQRNVAITGVEAVGAYAIRIRFNDGHDTGLYTWDWLYRLGEHQDQIWQDYLANLSARGLTRDAPGAVGVHDLKGCGHTH
ncbi:MAG: DUF971 domain-containing protein [Defluviicoccus sp.]|nr:MAG: DUF971 domain-containing protein [Defluviicoccus sp.]